MNMNILAVDTTTYSTFDFLADGETEKELLNRANTYKQKEIEEYNNIISRFEAEDKDITYFVERLESTKKKNYEIMTWDDFQAGQKRHLLNGELKEITKKEWEEMLNVLPPLMWCTINGVNMFCMSEMYTGTFTTQYARYNEKYYCKMVDSADKSTWIHNLLK